MKLNYEEFKEELIRRLEEIYDGEKEVMLNKVIKNNLGEVKNVKGRSNKIFLDPKSFNSFMNMGFINVMKAGFGYLGSCVKKRKENSLEDFYINRFGVPLYRMFFEDYTEKLWGIHPSSIAPDWGAQRVKGLSLLGVIKNCLLKPFIKKE